MKPSIVNSTYSCYCLLLCFAIIIIILLIYYYSFVCYVEDDIHAREGGIVTLGTNHAFLCDFCGLVYFLYCTSFDRFFPVISQCSVVQSVSWFSCQFLSNLSVCIVCLLLKIIFTYSNYCQTRSTRLHMVHGPPGQISKMTCQTVTVSREARKV